MRVMAKTADETIRAHAKAWGPKPKATAKHLGHPHKNLGKFLHGTKRRP